MNPSELRYRTRLMAMASLTSPRLRDHSIRSLDDLAVVVRRSAERELAEVDAGAGRHPSNPVRHRLR